MFAITALFLVAFIIGMPLVFTEYLPGYIDFEILGEAIEVKETPVFSIPEDMVFWQESEDLSFWPEIVEQKWQGPEQVHMALLNHWRQQKRQCEISFFGCSMNDYFLAMELLPGQQTWKRLGIMERLRVLGAA